MAVHDLPKVEAPVRFRYLAQKTKISPSLRRTYFSFLNWIGNRTVEGVGEPRLVPRVGKRPKAELKTEGF